MRVAIDASTIQRSGTRLVELSIKLLAVACWVHLAYVCGFRNQRAQDWLWASLVFMCFSAPLVLVLLRFPFAWVIVCLAAGFLISGALVEAVVEPSSIWDWKSVFPLVVWSGLAGLLTLRAAWTPLRRRFMSGAVCSHPSHVDLVRDEHRPCRPNDGTGTEERT
jgi:hypothetical protein